MDQLMNEIRAAIQGQAWLLALAGTLALPDMCAALESKDGKTDRHLYKAWVDRWLGDKYSTLESKDLYQMRCSFLHQGKASSKAYERIVFTGVTRDVVMHNNVIDGALNLDLPTFCEDIFAAVHQWQAAMTENTNYQTNIQKLVRWHPAGLAPYIVGIPVLS